MAINSPPALPGYIAPPYVVIYNSQQWAILKARYDSLMNQAEALLNQRRAILTEADQIKQIMNGGKDE